MKTENSAELISTFISTLRLHFYSIKIDGILNSSLWDQHRRPVYEFYENIFEFEPNPILKYYMYLKSLGEKL